MNKELLETIQNLSEEFNVYGVINFNTPLNAEEIVAEFSDQDGGEVSDEFYDAVVEALNEAA